MRKSKLICELIFIFLLPLVFLSFNISINHEYVYDENGNFKTSGLNVEMNNINFVNEVKDVHHGFEYVFYSEDEFNSLNLSQIDDSDVSILSFVAADWGYISFFDWFYDDVHYSSINQSGTMIYPYPYQSLTQGQKLVSLRFYADNNTSKQFNFVIDDSLSDYGLWKCVRFWNTYENGVFSLKFIDNFWVKDVVEVDEFHYKNPIYEICVQLDNYIGFDSTSTTMQIINAYTTLWVLMFFIWHLLYMFLDFFPHLFERKRE